MDQPNPNPLDGPTEVFIVSYSKDLPWLVYALRCMKKYLSGFQGVTICHPDNECHLFDPLLKEFDFMRLHSYPDIPGKSMLLHMVKIAEADMIVPPETKYILTCDSDCMYRMPTTPEHYAWNDKPYCIVRSWDSLTTEDPNNPGTKVVSDNLQWREPTDRQLGFNSEIFGMCMNTVMFPMDFFSEYRSHIRKVHNRSFRDVILSGRNEFPQSSMDFTAMVGFAYTHMHNRFHWFRVETPPYPVDRKQAYWSHGGITPETRAQIEGFLKGA
jgi:hypothetical protein